MRVNDGMEFRKIALKHFLACIQGSHKKPLAAFSFLSVFIYFTVYVGFARLTTSETSHSKSVFLFDYCFLARCFTIFQKLSSKVVSFLRLFVC